MKVLISFVAALAIMVGVLLWLLLPTWITPPQPAPAPRVAAAGEGVAAAEPAANPAAKPVAATTPLRVIDPPQSGPASHPNEAVRQSASASTNIRYPDAARRSAAEQRLARAREALESDPQSLAALDDAVAAARELEDWPSAADLLARKLALAPDDAALRFELAGLLLRQKRWVDAQVELRAVVAARPDDARAWHNLAIAQQAMSSLHEARRSWDRVVELQSDNVEARARRAEVLLDLQEWGGAAADLESCIAVDASAVDARLNLSLAYWRSGRLADAAVVLDSLIETRPGLTLAAKRRAQILAEIAEQSPADAAARQSAVGALESALKLSPTDAELTKLAERLKSASSRP